nr:amino acid adenylation domain-containing protein [Paraburkholderia sp. NMBU_R16]
MEGASRAYHIPFGIQLRGRLDRDALVRALERIVSRHAALRTTFGTVDGVPMQWIAPTSATSFMLRDDDLRNLVDSEDRNALQLELDRLIVAEQDLPFDLKRGPVIRGRLIRQADDLHTLLVTVHHIVADGWSMGILLRELGTLYGAFARADDDPLPPLMHDYADYSLWQRQTLTTDTIARQAKYWKTTLAGAPVLLDLPTDRQRPPQRDHRGASVRLSLDASLTAGLNVLAARHRTTLFMTVLTGWAILLSKLSRQQDLVIGTPVANRLLADTETMIGCFVNTLALRIDLHGAPSVAQLLGDVRDRVLAAQQHQDIPFEQVVELCAPRRSLAITPLFQAMFAWDNTPRDTLTLPGLVTHALPSTAHTTAKFDLTLSLRESGGHVDGGLEYATALFDRATVEGFAGYLRVLLQAMVDDDGRTVDSLPLIEPAAPSPARLPEAPSAPLSTLPPLFERHAARAPDAIALAHDAQTLTYAALNRRANRLARTLVDDGVGPGQVVAVALPRGFDLIVALLAILKSGAAYLPLDPDYPDERLAFMIDDTQPAALIAHTAAAERLSVRGTRIALDEPRTQARVSGMRDTDLTDADRIRPARPSDPAYIIYTSGSTGRPKGVVVEHCNVVRLLAVTESEFGFDRTDVWTLFHSFAFDFSVWEIWGALAYGGKLVIVPPLTARSPRDFYALLCRERVTVLNQTPSAFYPLIAEAANSATEHRLRAIVFGGEALELRKLAGWIAHNDPAHTRLVNMYGITEITVHATCYTIGRADIESGGGSRIGRPLADLQIHLLDGALQPVPQGVLGELYIGGPGLARGYLNRPALTAARFVANPYGAPGSRLYKTGDVGRQLPDGSLVFAGRNDDQVKIRGFRIEIGEIEARLAGAPSVREAAVLARDTGAGDRQLVAYVVPDPGHVLDIAQLRAHLASTLADYMVPSAYVALDALPLTVNGKLDRKALPAPSRDASTSRGYEAPANDTEAALADLWSDVLERGPIGRHDHFFELGGHSLSAVRLLSRIRDAMQLEVPLAELFSHPTLAGFAAAVAHAQRATPTAIVPVDRDGPLALSFAEEWLWLAAQIEGASHAYHVPFGYTLHGSLDRAALAIALSRLVARHEALCGATIWMRDARQTR